MQEKWHAWLDYRWGGWLCATWFACDWFRSRQWDLDPESIRFDRWLLLAILLASLLPSLWSAMREDLLALKSDSAGRIPRATWSVQVHRVLSYAFVACLLVVTYGRIWNFAEIGFRTQPPWSWTILLGLLCYRFQDLLRTAVDRWFYPAETEAIEMFGRGWVRGFVPRGRVAQLLQVFYAGIVSPVHEEIVYRGFLVYMLGQLAGQPWLGMLVGLVLCLLVHLYQGVWAIPSHLAFFSIAVGLMYSPAGLLTVVVMHIANNLQHALTMPSHVQSYLAYRRQVRQQKQPVVLADAD